MTTLFDKQTDGERRIVCERAIAEQASATSPRGWSVLLPTRTIQFVRIEKVRFPVMENCCESRDPSTPLHK